ncbi:hypothetical protein L0F51_01120 [Afifella sp. H1R]|uniref:hypothetical protein n=1 Tax=Afifella sp. H1R TaxID=2908841 RepID=UPI001F3E2518|nr:hypothetical protein [Afifella sp. H1R]MCF1502365.1 hypothetical protein [Afifella sp. H1R]
MRHTIFGPVLAAILCTSPALAMAASAGNDYPSEAIAEYVYACMKANGETRPVLSACACSIDVVASLLTYERYLTASTFLSMHQLHGEGADIFRNSPRSNASIQDLRRAQAEADVRCFKGN